MYNLSFLHSGFQLALFAQPRVWAIGAMEGSCTSRCTATCGSSVLSVESSDAIGGSVIKHAGGAQAGKGFAEA
jgi:hypothetical protein